MHRVHHSLEFYSKTKIVFSRCFIAVKKLRENDV